MKTKIFAAYLPQYHEVAENNMFWGKGFSDWVGVKNAKPQFYGHKQPKVPLNEYYYDLSDVEVIRWQANLAQKYRIDGFCMYHYWFDHGKTVLETPSKLLLMNKDIDIMYFFSWDNGSWIRSWSNISGNAWAPQFDKKERKSEEILLKHDYGNENDWENHFNYLLPFFRDHRYYKIDGKPVFILFHVDNPTIIKKMQDKWNELAIENGFPGVFMLSSVGPFRNKKCLDAQFKYEPIGVWEKKRAIRRRIGKLLNIEGFSEFLNIVSYKKAWNIVLRQSKKMLKQHIIMSGFVGYDDTPRRGNKASIVKGQSPVLFEQFFNEFYKLNNKYCMPFLLITAWNEWGEGAYLEPDDEEGFSYLEAVRKVVEKNM